MNIEIIGYSAAVVTNISIYPQAYEIFLIVKSREFDKLFGLSITMFTLQSTGCVLWLIYALFNNIYPVIMGSIMCLIPSIYIILCIVKYRPIENINLEKIEETESEIVIASGSSIANINNECYNYDK